MTDRSLWEILVPTKHNNGKPFTARYHRTHWDSKVRNISGGLTIMPVAKGQWVCPRGYMFSERMLPVRVLATREEIEQIVDITKEVYEQESVIAYKISNEVILR